jgi:putative methionine-R-sulfoxide reductase with GAF domain
MRDETKRVIRYYFGLSVMDWLKASPRLILRGVAYGLPLWLTYSAQRSETYTEAGVVLTRLVPLYPYRWPFVVLLCVMLVAAVLRLLSSDDGRMLTQRQFLALLTAGSLKQLQEAIRGCPGKSDMRTIRSGILSIIVDKTRELLQETRVDVYSANLMVADEAKKILTLSDFSRAHSNRKVIDVKFGDPGAGQAIMSGIPVYIPDIQQDGLRQHFRAEAPYRSILCLPIVCDHKKIGVVNVDSIRPDDLPSELLAAHLAPYVQLLGLSI